MTKQIGTGIVNTAIKAEMASEAAVKEAVTVMASPVSYTHLGRKMFIDLHMHECTYSKDSHLKLEEIVELAKKRGLGAVCITDHDDMGLKEYAAEYSKKTGFPIFVGIEFFSLQGDIVAFGIEEYPKERVNAQEFIDLVKAQGGICFSAHPFRNNNRGLEENLKIVHGLSLIHI